MGSNVAGMGQSQFDLEKYLQAQGATSGYAQVAPVASATKVRQRPSYNANVARITAKVLTEISGVAFGDDAYATMLNDIIERLDGFVIDDNVELID